MKTMFNRCISNSFFINSFWGTSNMNIISLEEAINNLGKICDILKGGGVIAVPTDTIYGVACLASNRDALKKIYSIKGRDENKPLAICVSHINDFKKISHVTVNDNCLSSLLPGPVTLIFQRMSTLPKELNPNTTSIGIRIPNNKFMIDLARYCDEPLALTSANISNMPSSLNILEFESIWKKLDLIVDGGQLGDIEDLKSKAGSTIIDLTMPGTFKITRDGTHYDEIVRILQEKCKLIRR